MSVVDEIRQKTDIVETISEYVKLQKSGSNFKANCPFHTEKTPSFYVFPERQSWHCFGACGTGGDVFAFIMKKESLDFSQALRLLADKTNVRLGTYTKQDSTQDNQYRSDLLKINEMAAEYFHYLLIHTEEGLPARQYTEKRGLSKKVIDDFQLGYSPSKWDSLLQYLKKAGFSEELILSSGLIIARESGGCYDRFRNRLIFPIRDTKGHVTGFGGRALDDSQPKYLNSPQTPLFDKSNTIYGLDRAHSSIKKNDSVVIMEGYMDVIAAHQFGFENSVAAMGTSLTDKQIKLLRRFSENIIIALDADAAGLEATIRSILPTDKPIENLIGWTDRKSFEDLLKFEIQVFALTGGKDPDEIIRKSTEEWKVLINNSQPIIDFTLKKEIDKISLDNPGEKSAVVSKFLPILNKVNDVVRRAHYIQKLARMLKIDEKTIRDALVNLQSIENKNATSKSLSKTQAILNLSSDSSHLENYCLALLLQFPDLRPKGMELMVEYFEHPENRYIFIKWQTSVADQLVMTDLDTAIHGHFSNLVDLARQFPPSLQRDQSEMEQVFVDCTNRLQEKYIKNLEQKKKLILSEDADKDNPDVQLDKLIAHGINESQKLKDIYKNRRSFYSKTKGE